MTTAVVKATETLFGQIVAPPSKSYTHRAIIAASLAEGLSHIILPLYANDILETINACASFGVSIEKGKTEFRIIGTSILKSPSSDVNCGDSASTIRFLTPIAALVKGKTVLDGSIGLRRRPIGPLVEALRKLGVQCSSDKGFPPVSIVGRTLTGGRTSLVGNISSQFVTGLLLACPLAEEDSEIALTTPLESKPYVKLTLNILSKHGVEVDVSRSFRKFNIRSKQVYAPKDHFVPGDFSSAAFLLAAAAMTNSDVTVKNLHLNHPDSEIVKILDKMGASTKVKHGSVSIRGNGLKGIFIDAKDIPDLVPVCAAVACVAHGTTHILGAKRLRIKESDRLDALSSELRRMGADISETDDGLTINGPCSLHGVIIEPHNDHRIAMACTIAGLKAKGKTEILKAECVDKSYPNFYRDLKVLGAKINVM